MGMIHSVMKKVTEVLANRSNASKLAYLKKKGCRFGENIRLNCGIKAFDTEPYLITLGDNVLVSGDVHFITHDGAIMVLNNLGRFPKTMDKMAPIWVGSNVYIGRGAYLMPGVRIGNNCIIGAGAIVTKDIPDNSVAVGIPARVVETVEEYYVHTVERGNLYETKGMEWNQKRKFYEDLKLRTAYFNEKE